MSEPVKPEDFVAVEYALGLLRGEARARVREQLESDDRLRAAADHWQQTFAELDMAEPDSDEALPAGMFDSILARIDAEGMQLPGTRTRRAGSANWREISPGVMSRVLHIDRAKNRQSLLIRMAPGAVYHSHAHDADEEAFIVEGDLSFGDLKLGAGDYHIAGASTRHPPGRTIGGCLVHVVTSLSH
ncbi:cupin domain-containing protein [Bradyrhizobium sp.]|uniref:cupin domain-containing protein n=1 Tax=Bradyrhizobium sp. TaxID=376 RepID=UPI001D3D3BFD|nr:cupin domain-containing protein [Bradyrhizobium sp.]MBI5321980.1 cupin domain-containing protein [Bradyrhizobium sp.]